MALSLSQLLPVGFLRGLFILFLAFASYFSWQFLNGSKKKEDDNKLLLKKLLDSFGLEIPSELKNLEGSVIKSIKTR